MVLLSHVSMGHMYGCLLGGENMGRLLAHCNRELPRLVGYLSFSSRSFPWALQIWDNCAFNALLHAPGASLLVLWCGRSSHSQRCFKTSMVAREKGVYGHVAVDLEIPPKELHPKSAVLKVVCVWFASLRHAGF